MGEKKGKKKEEGQVAVLYRNNPIFASNHEFSFLGSSYVAVFVLILSFFKAKLIPSNLQLSFTVFTFFFFIYIWDENALYFKKNIEDLFSSFKLIFLNLMAYILLIEMK
jgi:hypothetical protein